MPLTVQVEPPVAAKFRLQAVEVRHADEEAASRCKPAAGTLERRARIGEVLQHVPEDDYVVRVLRQLELLDAAADDLDSVHAAGRDHLAERLDRRHPVTGASESSGQPSVAGAEVEDAAPRGKPSQQPQLLTRPECERAREGRGEPAALRLDVVPGGSDSRDGRRRAAARAAEQRVAPGLEAPAAGGTGD